MQPAGPAPSTSTVSPVPTDARSWPLMQQASSSAIEACSKDIPSGIRFTNPFATTFTGGTMISAKPPELAYPTLGRGSTQTLPIPVAAPAAGSAAVARGPR